MSQFLQKLFYSAFLIILVFVIHGFFVRGKIKERIVIFPSKASAVLGTPQKYVVVDSSKADSLLAKGHGSIVVAPSPSCKIGPAQLAEESLDAADSIKPFSILRAEVEIESAEDLDGACVLNVHIIQPILGDKFSWFHAPIHPFATVVTLEDALRIPGHVLIDVRSPEEFKRQTLEDAINVPYTLTKPLEGKKAAGAVELDFLADRFDWNSPQIPKGRPLVVFSESPSDNRALRALRELHLRSLGPLYWIWSGVRELQPMPIVIPRELSCCTLVTPEEALAWISRDSSIIAVGNPLTVEQYHIEGAHFCTAASITECDSLPADKSRPVLIYGGNESSTAALDSAEKLHENGWRKIAILRKGLSEWIGWSKLEPNKYKIFIYSHYKHPYRSENLENEKPGTNRPSYGLPGRTETTD